MRILHTLHWVQFAGTEKVCVDLCNEFCKSHEVFLMTNDKIKTYTSDKVNLIAVDFEKNRYNPIFLYKIAKIIKDINPDVIHCHNAKELEIMYNARIFMKKKIPIVATRHNADLKTKFSYADLGVGVSKETMNFMNSKKNILIENGIPFKTPKKINLGNQFIILGVGRLAKVKGWDLLIQALSKVNFDFKLIILGEGNQKIELQNLCNETNIFDKVEFKFVTNVNDYIFSSDLQVIASKEEGLSLALIEAIFYGKILLASNISNHSDLIGTELVYDRDINILTNKLNDIYENYDKYKELFAKIKETKDNFSIEKMAEKYIQAYRSVIK